MRYINHQQHKATCGPVAVMNVMKHRGWKGSYRDNVEWFKIFGLSRTGMWSHELEKVLKFLNIKFKRLNLCKVTDIEKTLNRGNTVILNYQWYIKNKNAGHFIFITRHTKHFLNAYNITKCGSLKESKKLLRKWFKKSKFAGEEKPVMWEIL